MTTSPPDSGEPAFDIEKFLARSRAVREAAAKATLAANEASRQIEMELVRFDGENAPIDFNVDWSHETVWATQRQMADLFGKDADTIGHHLGSLYEDGEFQRAATTAKFAVVRLEGGRQVRRDIDHYNLDVILVVGYRVNGPRAADFRRWANGVLKRYITEGFALNDSRLRADNEALQRLAAEVRALRSEEISIYQAVRDCFKLAASDYDKDAPTVRSFYAKLQDKFLYAITGMTASQLIIDRADASKMNMGMEAMRKSKPTLEEAKIGKSYLAREEIYILHILCEQFLLYAESKALRGKSMTMDELALKLDALLKTNDYAVFAGYRDYLKNRAMEHAKLEWERWSSANLLANKHQRAA